MTKGRRVAAWLLLAAALGLSILGQLYFFPTQGVRVGWPRVPRDGRPLFRAGLALDQAGETAYNLSPAPAFGRLAASANGPRSTPRPGRVLFPPGHLSMQDRTLSERTHDAVLFWGLGVVC